MVTYDSMFGSVRIRNTGVGNVQVLMLKGETGKTAYQYAVENGYEGTEEEFQENVTLAGNSGQHFATLDSDVAALDSRLDSAESDIDTLEDTTGGLNTRLTAAEGNITSQDTRLTTAESDIDALETATGGLNTRLTAAEENITSHGTRLTAAESDIDALETSTSGLNTRLTAAENDIDTLETDTAELSEKLSNVDAVANLPLIVNGIPTEMVVKIYSIGAYGIVPEKRCMYAIGEYEGNGTVTKVQIYCRDSSNVTRLFIDNLLPGNNGVFFIPEGTTAFRITGIIENETDTSDGKKLPIVFTQTVNSADVDSLYKAFAIPDDIIWKDGYTNDKGIILPGDENNRPVYTTIYDVEHLDFALSFSESHDLRLIVSAYGNNGVQIQRDTLINAVTTGRNAAYDAPANAAYVIVWYRTFNESNVLTMTGTLRTSNISKRSVAIEDVTPKAFNTTWERKTYTNSQIQDSDNTRAMSALLSLRSGDTYTSTNGILMRLVFCLDGVPTSATGNWENKFTINDNTLSSARNGVRVLCKLGSAGSAEIPFELCERSVYHTGSNEELVTVDDYDPTVPVVENAPTIVAAQGKRYLCGTVTSLSFTPSAKGLCEVVFTSGTSPAVLTGVDNVRWPAWFNPAALAANTTYDLMVSDGTFGVVATWTA